MATKVQKSLRIWSNALTAVWLKIFAICRVFGHQWTTTVSSFAHYNPPPQTTVFSRWGTWVRKV